MLELSFTAADVAYTRFAFSPVWECVASVLVLKGDLGRGIHDRWTTQARARLHGFDWHLFGDLVRPAARVIPGFVCPPPTSPLPDLDAELAILRATPADQIAREITAIPGITTPPP